MQTNIIVAGYPKSGCTWVTRLAAELVQCPIVGFLDHDHEDIAQEGQNRGSVFRCYKAHQQLHDVRRSPIAGNSKIIYVVRDPRDIAISGAHYFQFVRPPCLATLLDKYPRGNRAYMKMVHPWVSPLSYRIEQMMRAVLYGSRHIDPWVRLPWKNHYPPYVEDHCFLLTFENLLAEPQRECKRMLEYLGLRRSSDEVRKAVEKQSFEKKKAGFLKTHEIAKAGFMRAGTSGQWRHELTGKQKELFSRTLAVQLKQFGYSD